jgi:ABC-type nitrate/sulfonate/bicarbonate transport system permease component
MRAGRFASAAAFALPLLALLVIWEAVVRGFDVSPRVFPAIEPVVKAGIDSVADGTLIRHIGASLVRIALGTSIGIVIAVPLGVAMRCRRSSRRCCASSRCWPASPGSRLPRCGLATGLARSPS